MVVRIIFVRGQHSQTHKNVLVLNTKTGHKKTLSSGERPWVGFFWTCGNKILRSKSTNCYDHKKIQNITATSSITTAHDNFYTFSHTITGIDFPRNGTRDSSTFIWFENGQVTRENKVTVKKEKAGKLAKLTSSKARKGTLPALLSIIIIVCYGKHCKWCCSGFYTAPCLTI